MLQAYKGYVKDGQFYPSTPINIPTANNAVLTILDDTCSPELEAQNAKYLAKLDESIAQAERGEVVRYTMDELKTLVYGK